MCVCPSPPMESLAFFFSFDQSDRCIVPVWSCPFLLVVVVDVCVIPRDDSRGRWIGHSGKTKGEV